MASFKLLSQNLQVDQKTTSGFKYADLLKFKSLYLYIEVTSLAVPYLRWLVTGFSLWRPRLNPGIVHMRFVVDKVDLGHAFPY